MEAATAAAMGIRREVSLEALLAVDAELLGELVVGSGFGGLRPCNTTTFPEVDSTKSLLLSPVTSPEQMVLLPYPGPRMPVMSELSVPSSLGVI